MENRALLNACTYKLEDKKALELEDALLGNEIYTTYDTVSIKRFWRNWAFSAPALPVRTEGRKLRTSTGECAAPYGDSS